MIDILIALGFVVVLLGLFCCYIAKLMRQENIQPRNEDDRNDKMDT